jgi:hypothetical protein
MHMFDSYSFLYAYINTYKYSYLHVYLYVYVDLYVYLDVFIHIHNNKKYIFDSYLLAKLVR